MAAMCCAVFNAWSATPVSYVDANGVEKSCTEYTEITAGKGFSMSAGWYVVNGNKNAGYLDCSGDVHLILTDGCRLDCYLIFVPSTASITIYGQTNQTGKIYANSIVAGCIGGYGQCVGSITINGGDIYAVGFGYSAGIGGGDLSNGTLTISDITINGGKVTAKGGNNGAGIGGSDYTDTAISNIRINGGIVTAIAGVAAKSPAIGTLGTISGIYVRPSLTIKAGSSESTSTTLSNDGSNLATVLSGTTGPKYVYIEGSITPSGLEQVAEEQVSGNRKVLKDGKLLIIKQNGEVYNAIGVRVE